MSNELYNEIAKQLLTSDRYEEDGNLRQLHIVDLGTITEIENGYATIRSFAQQAGEVVEYFNVEVLYIGSVGGGIDIVPAGSLCLLIRPAIPVLDTQTEELVPNERPYSGSGMKAIPLTNCMDADVHAGWTESGAFQLNTDAGLSIVLDNSQLLIGAKGSTLFRIDKSGAITRMLPKHRCVQKITDTGTTTIYYDDSHNPKFKVEVTMDGVKYYAYENNAWKERHFITNTEAKISFGENTQVDVKDGSALIQTGSNIKIEMDSSAVTVNGHLKVT